MAEPLPDDEIEDIRARCLAEGDAQVWGRSVLRLLATLDAARAETKRLGLSETHALEQRDEAIEWADKLAGEIAGEDEIGEHSNCNHPWTNAIECLEGERRRAKADLDAARAERDDARNERDILAHWLEECRPELAALRALADAVEDLGRIVDGPIAVRVKLAAVRAAQGKT